ncbi:hypothetical protein CDD83_8009 [Cordyceps sp. RAO-2017]|nr:hypothetical protein CDD83_8009 [Cordyceps sp. RAO-2017]
MLYGLLGASGIAGVAVTIALLPLRSSLSKRQSTAQRKASGFASARGKLSTELVASIHLIKSYAWESCFQKRLVKPREEELEKLKSRFMWWSAYIAASCSASLVTAVVTFFCYTVIAGRPLRISNAFPALIILAVLRQSLDRASDIFSFASQASLSMGRIDTFLSECEARRPHQLPQDPDGSIGFVDATLEWFHQDARSGLAEEIPLMFRQPPPPFRLRNVHINFVPGGLNVVFGRKGSGKSSLLLALLGEMDLVSGRLHLPLGNKVGAQPPGLAEDPFALLSTAAYCPSQPWLQNDTIRANVTFGLEFDYARYKAVMSAVALLSELPKLPRGDLTQVGDNGSALSADQRPRVALARALYSRARYVLLDDCLSGLSDATAQHLFVHGIQGPLMEGRTCILATRRCPLALSRCHHAVCLKDGSVGFQGSPAQLVATGVLSPAALLDAANLFAPRSKDQAAATRRRGAGDRTDDGFIFKNFSKAPTIRERDSGARGGQEDDEPMDEASWPAIKRYLESMGSKPYWLMVSCAFVVQQLACLSSGLWIRMWARSPDGNLAGPVQEIRPYYIGIYATIAAASVLFALGRDAIFFRGALKASRTTHNQVLAAVFHAKFSFFDRIPIKNIASRLTKDMEVMDQDLAPICLSALYLLAGLVMTAAFMSVMAPLFPLIAIPVGMAYACVGTLYIRSHRQLDRILGSERLPMFEHVRETLSGSVSICAYGRAAAFTKKAYELTDLDTRTYLLRSAAKEWLTFRVNCLSAVLSSLTGAIVLWTRGAAGGSADAAGLVLALSLTFNESILALAQLVSQSQGTFGAANRVMSLMDAEQEPREPIKERRALPCDWPARGSVRFRNYSARYGADQGFVLKHINISIRGGQRVAIVGHRGAGKSTLAMAMIRGLEAAEGRVELDGVDVASVRLDQLRRLVTIVPQDLSPALFRGSVRECLDPELRHADERMFEIIQGLRLSRFIPVDLDEAVPPLCPSQRQLLCVAHALLRKSPVIVLDEATDGLDEESHELVQRALHDGIAAGTTVVTITNCPASIADYDQVVVMAGGAVAEEGSPCRLLDKDEKQDHSALFRRDCIQSGDLQLIERIAGLRT